MDMVSTKQIFLHVFMIFIILKNVSIEAEVISPQDYKVNIDDELKIFGGNRSSVSFSINSTYEYENFLNFNLSTLKYVAVVTRHGSRSPFKSYPNDPYPYYNSKYWPDGIEQLTRYGKQQLYESGKILRDRYNGFISKHYIVEEISVRTNLYDRDFMSAACLLAGLYPPSGYQEWNPFILWQPIPIWEQPYDVVPLGENPTLCPRYYNEMNKMKNELNNKGNQHTKLLEYVSNHTGTNIKYSELYDIGDTFIMQQENGFKLPEWSKLIYPEPLLSIYAMEFSVITAGTQEMARLAAGPLLKKINSQLSKKAERKMIPNRLMYIEAAHDSTLLVLFKSFGFNSPFVIETSAFMVFELHEYNDKHFVQVLYYNSSAKTEPNILNLPVCPTPCNINDFNYFVKSFSPVNWKEECQLPKTINSQIQI
ncbi:hypothetical protein O3M35_003166 [Rhynocoris fuscipes]|uniref:acid phosphatase n=1 Tax=Rhynocoris fuscipes TaxID=488301 RepID=A0AAW1CJH8_9HEMI